MTRECAQCGAPVPKRYCERCGQPYSGDPQAPPVEPPEPPGDGATGVVAQPPSCLVLTTGVSRDSWNGLSESSRPDFPEPPPSEKRFELRRRPGESPIVLGREKGAPADVELRLPGTDAASGVSKRHCAFHRAANGRWEVRDQGSTNGTRVEQGPWLRSGQSWELKEGDRILVGAWSCVTVHIED